MGEVSRCSAVSIKLPEEVSETDQMANMMGMLMFMVMSMLMLSLTNIMLGEEYG